MSENGLFPEYIRRSEERRVRAELRKVRADGQSRVVLLYGEGGIGKTSMVRRLAQDGATSSDTVWVESVDIDDSDYWLLSNLEQHVATQLDVGGRYFDRYLEYLSRLPVYARSRTGYETVVSHLARIKRVFVECYREFVRDSGQTVVITLDTVEAIRGMYLLVTLTQWIKALPATLFIMSGRPPLSDDARSDQIKDELQDPHRPLPVNTIRITEFSRAAALRYFAQSSVSSGLTKTETEKLVLLTRGHPLWLAFTVDYLSSQGVPEEAAANELDFVRSQLPYGEPMTPDGENLHEEFKRRLVAPYHETDFWHEAIKRLSVVRESIDEAGWWELMADRRSSGEPADVDAAWEKLLAFPWIRPRASRHYVTLHDAVAEELAKRIIPLHDRGKQWRCQLWSHAAQIYQRRSQSRAADLSDELERLETALHSLPVRQGPDGEELSADEESRIIGEAARLEPQRRELSKVKSVWLYYELLSNFEGGCKLFLELMEQAKNDHDILFQNLLAAEIQRFLPGNFSYPHGDAVGEVVREFHRWLEDKGAKLHLEIGLSLADYLIRNEQPADAFAMLNSLPTDGARRSQRYRLSNLRGNACMRIPGHVGDGEEHFQAALTEAVGLRTDDRQRLIAKAYKELGFYYRNRGMWKEADASYQQARDAISQSMLARWSDEDREEMASIQTNWAYVKGLTGLYHEGTNLVESAITVRRKLSNSKGEGNSWSVFGEVYRYQRRFQRAWEAYTEAERIFQELRNWSWLGLVYQEQAICVFQARQERIELVADPGAWAKRRINVALDLCRDQAVRGYPSALNRAGRIFGADDYDEGLKYLADGIEWAEKLYDGWFRFANLIEYSELCYRAWVSTGQQGYRAKVRERRREIAMVMNEYEFPDLKGRWELLQGHFSLQDARTPGREGDLEDALAHYKEGFALIAKRHVGSSGAASITGEFKTLQGLMEHLSPETRQNWLQELRQAWSGKTADSTLLLARLEELYD